MLRDLTDANFPAKARPIGWRYLIVRGEPVPVVDLAVLLGDDLVHSEVPAIGQMATVHERTGRSIVALMEVPPAETRHYGIFSGRRWRLRIGSPDALQWGAGPLSWPSPGPREPPRP